MIWGFRPPTPPHHHAVTPPRRCKRLRRIVTYMYIGQQSCFFFIVKINDIIVLHQAKAMKPIIVECFEYPTPKIHSKRCSCSPAKTTPAQFLKAPIFFFMYIIHTVYTLI